MDEPGGRQAFWETLWPVRGTSETWWRLERAGLTMPVRVDPAALRGPTRRQARGPGWRRTSRGLFVPAGTPSDGAEQRIVEAAAVLPRGGGVTGWAALRWSGGAWFDGMEPGGQTPLPVTLAIGDSRILAQPGFEVSEEHLRPYDMEELDGLPLTSAVRSVTYLMRHASTLLEAVTALDMAAYNDLVSVNEVLAYQPTLPAWTGIPLCRKASVLADENAWSPREVKVRLTWTMLAELPRPLCNRPVFDRAGRHVATPDLLDEEAGVALEYDGELHLAGAQRRRDRDREEALRRVGLEYLTVMAGDSDERVADRMREVRARARWEAPSRRDWTVDLPSWWVPTFTVDQRRELDHEQRSRWLRLRRTA